MDFTEKYTNDKEKRLLLRKIKDLIQRAEKSYTVLYSAFLDPASQALLCRVSEFTGRISLTGGYEDAERRLCRVNPGEYAEDSGAPIVLWEVNSPVREAVFSHRDVLGSLMGLGIRRDMIGDILPHENSALFFCHTSSSDFIRWNLTKIGHYPVNLSPASFSQVPTPSFTLRTVNVPSLRLDCIAGEAFGLSRTKAAEAIRKGLVFVNWLEITDPSHEIHPGDKISLRGKGKIEIDEVSGMSKKGRLFIQLRQKQ